MKDLLISDESDKYDPDSDTEKESLISTTEVEIKNDDRSLILTSEEEEAEMFPEGSIFMQEMNEVIDMFPEDRDNEVLRSADSRPRRDNVGTGID